MIDWCQPVRLAPNRTPSAHSGRPDRRWVRIDTRAVELVRDYLTTHAREQTPASMLE